MLKKHMQKILGKKYLIIGMVKTILTKSMQPQCGKKNKCSQVKQGYTIKPCLHNYESMTGQIRYNQMNESMNDLLRKFMNA